MIRTIFLLFVALLIAALAALNWATLSTSTDVSLGITTVHAPLGLIMLALTVALAIVFAVYVLYLQGTALMDTRRQTRELQAQRTLADKAEASRLTELRAHLDARLTDLQAALVRRIEESDNDTAAQLGQIEDRINRTTGETPPVVVTPAAAQASERRDPGFF